MARRIIIDTDPGQDDAVAILLALASPELDVVCITAVAGNVPLALTEVNARKIVDLTARDDVPVYAGAARPLLRPLVTAEHVHGRTGLDGPDLPPPVTPLAPGHGVDAIIETLRAGPATVCTLGPMTNLALALIKAPEIAENIDEIVAMGGGFFEGGNITPAAEFNIYVDPHAAATVFASGRPITLFPLDVTHQCLTTAARLTAFRALGTRAGEATAALLDFFERFDEEKYGTDGGPLHDPTVIAWLLRPALFTHRHINVEIETASPLTLGMTVADWWGVSGRRPNTRYVRSVDADGYFDLLLERIGRLP